MPEFVELSHFPLLVQSFVLLPEHVYVLLQGPSELVTTGSVSILPPLRFFKTAKPFSAVPALLFSSCEYRALIDFFMMLALVIKWKVAQEPQQPGPPVLEQVNLLVAFVQSPELVQLVLLVPLQSPLVQAPLSTTGSVPPLRFFKVIYPDAKSIPLF
jgi:hypothetical protein